MKEELQDRKKELEVEAQALASQYEQIYKETIRKMKNDIEKEQAEIEQMEAAIELARQEKADLELKTQQVGAAVEQTQQEYEQVAGRNKAFILYASELQDRLDKMKSQRLGTGRKKGGLKLKEDIEGSRRLLTLKRGEVKSL